VVVDISTSRQTSRSRVSGDESLSVQPIITFLLSKVISVIATLTYAWKMQTSFNTRFISRNWLCHTRYRNVTSVRLSHPVAAENRLKELL